MVLEYTVNEDLKIVSSWFESNYLKINDTKTQAMVIGPSEYKYNFKLDDSEIKLTDTLRILGVTFDRKLKFKDHIVEQTKKACAKASALRRLRRFIPQDVMIRLYKAYILPHLAYCGPLLLGIGKIEANKLEDTKLLHFVNRLGAVQVTNVNIYSSVMLVLDCLLNEDTLNH